MIESANRRIVFFIIALAAVIFVAHPAFSQTTAPGAPGRQGANMTLRTIAPQNAKPNKKYPAAIVLAPKSDYPAVRRDVQPMLRKAGFYVVWPESPGLAKAKKNAGLTNREPLFRMFDRLVEHAPIKRDGIVLIAVGEKGPDALSIIDRYHKRLAGAVLIAVSPVWIGRDVIRIWQPVNSARRVAIWATVGTRVRDAAPILLNWRKFAADAPAAASVTVDPRIGKGKGFLAPDGALLDWLKSIAAGKIPKPGPDRQAQNERALYARFVRSVRKVWKSVRTDRSGPSVSKRSGPFELTIQPPAGWLRDKRGEKKYDPKTFPFVQLYFTPTRQGPFFARAQGGSWSAGPEGLLDKREKLMRREGYLVVRYARWSDKLGPMQVSSVLWPTRRKWHRWFVLSAAVGASSKSSSLITVMDASARPDVGAMIAALKSMRASVHCRYFPAKSPRSLAPRRGFARPAR